MAKIFIDGKEGTTGLKIYERFANRNDIELLTLSEENRKNPEKRAEMINASDFTFLCLPDIAAIESAELCTNPKTVIIDASTAHRTNPDWAYGFPELDDDFRKKIQTSNRIAVPGCYASGSVAILYPLVKSKILPKDYPVVIHAVSGYSGAGKKAISAYESSNRNPEFDSPRLYALSQNHKHLPEIKKISGLEYEPIFNPYVCDYFQGMTVSIGLHTRLLQKKVTPSDILEMFQNHYKNTNFIKVSQKINGEDILTEPFIAANSLANTNQMQIFVCGNDERIVITTRFDNLGKGASGAAVQCLNIRIGIDETEGLK